LNIPITQGRTSARISIQNLGCHRALQHSAQTKKKPACRNTLLCIPARRLLPIGPPIPVCFRPDGLPCIQSSDNLSTSISLSAAIDVINAIVGWRQKLDK